MIIFDGRKIADEKGNELRKKVTTLSQKEIVPNIVSVVVGDSGGAMFYQNLKKKKAKSVGCILEVKKYPENVCLRDLDHDIKLLNKDENVHGVMIQLPLPDTFSKSDREAVINSIDPKKDVDGMRDDSKFVSPVTLAVTEAVSQAERVQQKKEVGPLNTLNMVVVGAKGFEGRKIIQELRIRNKDLGIGNKYEIKGVDVETKDLKNETLDADIIISVTGVADLIKPEMIKNGVALIDVGYPKGDVSESCFNKASFVSPVPGGIGPLTIYYLLENLVESALML